MTQHVETHSFQAETQQLLHLMIHSLYTNKEIFLRELISNASDALDKLRFEYLTHPELKKDGEALEIRLELDKEARTLTIHDNGIGMSKEEVIKNIGTIAHSGTKELITKLKASENQEMSASLIGQFGVGFYSSFMVADKVSLVTRRAGEEGATRWTSTGDGTYELSDAARGTHGTSITLHLKDADPENKLDDYTELWQLKRIVKRYSDFVNFPIRTREEREEPKLDEEGNEIEGQVEHVIEDLTLNSMKPLWTRQESDLKEEELSDFYKHVAHDWRPPLTHLLLKVEGMLEYQALLFLPSEPPHDLYYYGAERGLQLYVRRVLIMDRCEELLPSYLRFVRGVVDSSDLPLNVSRELLQQDRHIPQIRKYLSRKLLDKLKEMKEAEDNADYLKFWKACGRALKEGIAEDFDNRERIADLLLFQSSADPEKLVSLREYIERMKEGQEAIYYLTGESREVVEKSPHLEAFKAKEVEVLYLTDAIDEIMLQHLEEYKEKKLKSVGKGEIDLGTEEEKEKAEKERKEKQKEVAPLLEKIQEKLSDYVKEVRLSSRLTDSPVCLVGNEQDYSAHFERLLNQSQGAKLPKQKRVMELNPQHSIFQQLEKRFQANSEDDSVGEYAEVLLGYALLAEGSALHDPHRFNQLVANMLERSLTA
ncbi:MAG: molecular chaperone HtpG [Myxococcales bacterium]|nr:molecular chaperone HtpG [Myxococcales bacterium]